jgi:hypothetical protein
MQITRPSTFSSRQQSQTSKAELWATDNEILLGGGRAWKIPLWKPFDSMFPSQAGVSAVNADSRDSEATKSFGRGSMCLDDVTIYSFCTNFKAESKNIQTQDERGFSLPSISPDSERY